MSLTILLAEPLRKSVYHVPTYVIMLSCVSLEKLENISKFTFSTTKIVNFKQKMSSNHIDKHKNHLKY